MTHTAAYDADALDEPTEAGSSGWLREIVVHVSMMIVIAALGMALRTSFGFGVLPSIIIALTTYWGLLVLHALVRRGQEALGLSDEVAHLTDENAALRRLVGARRTAEAMREPPRLAGLVAERPPPRIMERKEPLETSRARAPEAPKAAAKATGERSTSKTPVATAPVATAPKIPAAPHAPAKLPAAPAGARAAPPPLPARPRAQGLAALAVEKPVAKDIAAKDILSKDLAPKTAAEPPHEADHVAETEDPRAQDIAIMQSLIKGLADQINAPAAKTEPMEVSTDTLAAAPVLDPVDEQVGVLRDMAEAMRGPADMPIDYDRGLRAEITDALEASRIDVYLDPILGLDDRRARHFEVSLRLRSLDGDVLDPQEFAGAIAGSGLGPRIEAQTFTESIRLAGEFATRGSAADLFSSASGESLRDGRFHAALSDGLAPDGALGTRLVMSITQAEVRAFGPAHWDALDALSLAGLRYALVDVVDLDMDLEMLADRGFEFVRLDAPVFLQGLPAPHGFVPAPDLCRHLSGLGFTLIVSRIVEERELVKVLGFGALLGQGRLFGGPRPIRQDRAPARSSAA